MASGSGGGCTGGGSATVTEMPEKSAPPRPLLLGPSPPLGKSAAMGAAAPRWARRGARAPRWAASGPPPLMLAAAELLCFGMPVVVLYV